MKNQYKRICNSKLFLYNKNTEFKNFVKIYSLYNYFTKIFA